MAPPWLPIPLPAGTIVCMNSAWRIHTGAPPTVPIDVVGTSRTRKHAELRPHNLTLAESEIVTIGTAQVTSILRTAADILRLEPVAQCVSVLEYLRENTTLEEFTAYLAQPHSWRKIQRARALLAAMS